MHLLLSAYFIFLFNDILRVPNNLLDVRWTLEVIACLVMFIRQLIKSSHSSEVWAGYVEYHLEGDVNVLVLKASLNPFRQFLILASSHVSGFCQDHQPIVSLLSHDSTQTLGDLTHSIKLEKFVSIPICLFYTMNFMRSYRTWSWEFWTGNPIIMTHLP